jgi:hypothetical protein
MTLSGEGESEALLAKERHDSHGRARTVRVVMLVVLSLVFVSTACASSSASRRATTAAVNAPPLTVEVATPAPRTERGVLNSRSVA